ncbi:hypothetical protein LRP50_04495 [Enterovibrio sp. ZSDZ42]|uniref:Glycosyltransferase 2-like domain-containing protein n=1 Tax=Enterovibrio gelatinilyticus TaxID=2899819 RepID=A0ABT5QWK5_9GAMM|nr:hypothetical protein [Enterovibrio sp. ZSDZ42]MDD1792384.1 hypothetical protein [Enterovibrio sp. ZSDZ42]
MLSEKQVIELNKVISDSCVLVIQSCDAYEDVWEMFFSALSEHWPGCSLRIILNTETKTTSFGDLNIDDLNFNGDLSNPQWGEKLLNVLNHVEHEFVITLFDDFILEDRVNVEKILRCLDLMKRNENIGVFYFNNIPTTQIESFDEFYKLGRTTDYKVNSCPALWRKKILQEMTGTIDNPWAWEFFGSARAYGDKYEFYCATPDKEDVFVYQYQLGGAIRRGKWVEKVIIPAIKKYNLSLDSSVRGFASESLSEGKYSLGWKVKFIRLGFEMVGFKAMLPLLRAVLQKIKRTFQ